MQEKLTIITNIYINDKKTLQTNIATNNPHDAKLC